MSFLNLFTPKKTYKSNKSNITLTDKCMLDGITPCKKDKSLRPMIARAGGKSKLKNRIINMMPKHSTYVEPFVGGGAIFLSKPSAKINVLNDKDKELIKVYNKFKNGDGFNKCVIKPSKSRFNNILNKKNKSACDFAYINKLSFGSKGGTYKKTKCSTCSTRNRNDVGITYQKKHQIDYKQKLKNAKIFNSDFRKIMQKYDSKETLHYLDPPYVKNGEIYTEHGVTPKEVCDTVKKMKGKVILSYDNNPITRKACKGLKFHKVRTIYTLDSESNNKAVT